MHVIEERRVRLLDSSPRVIEISDNSEEYEDEDVEEDSRNEFDIESVDNRWRRRNRREQVDNSE